MERKEIVYFTYFLRRVFDKVAFNCGLFMSNMGWCCQSQTDNSNLVVHLTGETEQNLRYIFLLEL